MWFVQAEPHRGCGIGPENVCDRDVTVWGTGMKSLLPLRGFFLAAAVTTTTIFSGCVSGPVYFDDPTSMHEPGTDAWWGEKAQLPLGERRRMKHGKVWPMRPRPSGPKQHWSHTYHATHHWPLPYVCQDRQYVRDVFAMQAAKGWADETTLSEYHFDPESHELSVPGRQHLNWILNIAPGEHRNVHLQESANQNVNQMRLASLQQAISELSMGDAAPHVQWRRGAPLSRPASQVRQIQAMDMSNLPAPVIGGAGGGGAAGGGGGGASAGGSGGATGP